LTANAFICGSLGYVLEPSERAFFAAAQPVGFILFARNVDNPDQVLRLIEEVKDAAGRDNLLILIDQEGGRVQRMRPPHWRQYPPASAYCKAGAGDLDKAERHTFLNARSIAHDLYELGVNTACAPVLDLPVEGADKVIGDRAYGADVETVVRLGRAFAEGLLAGHVLPVMKHIPGHGRATADSHFALPVISTPLDVLAETDFATFAALKSLPMAMTAHVVMTDVDADAPVTTSKTAIERVIRGMIGFDGLLMSDDLSMRALSGSLGSGTAASFEAGCDVALHCNGMIAEMEEVAGNAPRLQGDALRRFDRAWDLLRLPEPFDREEAEAALRDSLAATA